MALKHRFHSGHLDFMLLLYNLIVFIIFFTESPNLGTVIVADENDETAMATPLAYLFTGSDADAADSFTFSLGANSDST